MMRSPGTVFLYYWKSTTYNDAFTSITFITQGDKKKHLGFWPLVQNKQENTSCKPHFSEALETDYFTIGLRALSYKAFNRKNILPPSGIGVYLGIIDALKNFELSEEDEKGSIQKKLFEYAENWKVGLELGNMQLSPLESAQLTVFCEILAEKMVGLPEKKFLIEEIVCLGAPAACVQLSYLDALKMENFFQALQHLHNAKKLSWHSDEAREKHCEQHNSASIIFRLLQAGGISSYTKKYKGPTNTFFQKVGHTTITPATLCEMAKHAEATQLAPEKQGCACAPM